MSRMAFAESAPRAVPASDLGIKSSENIDSQGSFGHQEISSTSANYVGLGDLLAHSDTSNCKRDTLIPEVGTNGMPSGKARTEAG